MSKLKKVGIVIAAAWLILCALVVAVVHSREALGAILGVNAVGVTLVGAAMAIAALFREKGKGHLRSAALLFGAGFGTIVIAAVLFPTKQDSPPAAKEKATAQIAGKVAMKGKGKPPKESVPSAGAPLPMRIRAAMIDSGGLFAGQSAIPEDHIEGFRYSAGIVDIAVNVGTWTGLFEGTELRRKLSGPLATFQRIAGQFPQIRIISATFESPATEQKDEFGNVAKERRMATVAVLNIDCQDLRKFPDDFGWGEYSVYAANRYVSSVNVNSQETWQSELKREIEIGGFQQD